MNDLIDDIERLKQLEAKLAHYMPIYLEKKRNFHGVKHENSLSELRYTEFMVYKDMVEGIQRDILEMKRRLRNK